MLAWAALQRSDPGENAGCTFTDQEPAPLLLAVVGTVVFLNTM